MSALRFILSILAAVLLSGTVDPDVSKWKTAIHVIHADGTGLHQLTDGTHTDFNQTWTRDGRNTPIWN